MISFIEDNYNYDNDDNYYVVSQGMWGVRCPPFFQKFGCTPYNTGNKCDSFDLGNCV